MNDGWLDSFGSISKILIYILYELSWVLVSLLKGILYMNLIYLYEFNLI